MIADILERRFPAAYRILTSIQAGDSINLRTIPETHQVWCSDYMLIRVAEGKFVRFRYEPDYLIGKYRHPRAGGEC